MERIERAKSLTELVTNTLRHSIVEGELELGEALSESKIASRLDVSRTPVREAFARLEIEGLVFAEPQKNTRVFTLGPKDFADICDVRCCLEAKALALAMERRRKDLAAALAETTRRMTEARETGQTRAYLRLDTQFHQRIFDHADNVFLNDAYQTVASKIAALRNRLGSHPDHLKKGFAEHLRLSELIARGGLGEALELLDAHIARREGSFWNLDDGLSGRDGGVTPKGMRPNSALQKDRLPSTP
ncbi:GntR family transcriptional regulator [Telmatospirillum siberiense]|uniref:GntR family transcriptional regulator n=1 Tax=Telmatospirillum siberiense TaxID=382514 RepID=A0A2N3PSM3_9PROT|nr:GntR family transcriptional regulator [Telmatospirillum siberiense]PKU23403.1 GntR family transcriptional regulator [Telmatospirillum siberiense]